MTDILMPKLSDSMEQGTVISWFKDTGDHVDVGDELLEIETDKSTAPYEAEVAGVLEIMVPVGTTVAVGDPLGRIGDPTAVVASAHINQAAQPQAPAIDRHAPTTTDDETSMSVSSVITPSAETSAATNRDGSVKVTPLARRVASAHGVSLATVRGTGLLGRITRSDVLTAAGIAHPTPTARRHTSPPPIPVEIERPVVLAPAPVASRPGNRQELTRSQQLVARRMAEAKATIPHFQVQTEVDVGAALALREELKALAGDAAPAPSVNDVIVKAAAIALRSHPLANGSFKDGGFELHADVNVGVAVAADGALAVPVIHSADIKSLGQIAAEVRRLATAVRNQTIAPPDLAGGTFTVSNLGMFGMTAITPVVNPPEAAILGVGATRATLARVDGEIVDRNVLTLTLSCDHRILYGAEAARFLAEIRSLLEAPLRLAL